MNKFFAGIGMLVGGFLATTVPQDSTARPQQATAVVGTFDSRGVAVAYVSSNAFKEYLTAQRADITKAIERARAAGDLALARELEALGPAMQDRIHRQGFGTAPIDDIMTRLADKLPGVAEKAGVDVIVSKWATSYHKPAAKFVDVTEQLVALFEPSAETLANIRKLVASEPMSPEQLEHHKH
jgi:hypothetical protein